MSKSYVAVVQYAGGWHLVFSVKDAETAGPELSGNSIQLRGIVAGDVATYACSTDDGATFKPIGAEVKLAFGWWKGARPAVSAFNTDAAAKANGFVDVDWVHYRALAAASSNGQP